MSAYSEVPLISIIVPTRNEAKDIRGTLDAILGIDYEPKEIIVVDDSTDETPQIVSRYADRGVHLIHRECNSNGCCGARNLGIQVAKGEIIVIANGDNRPRPDFLRRLLVHYQNGADYVIVKSTILNRNNLWGKYTMAKGLLAWETLDPEWSEGFSCRTDAAKAVGYIPGDFPIPFCRDYRLGLALREAGYKKHVDVSIPMEHKVPGTLSSYWHNQVWRGSFSAPHAYYFRKLPLWMIGLRELLKLGRTILLYLLVVPALWRTGRISKHAPNGWRDAPSLFLAGLVQNLAITIGNFKGLKRLIQALRKESKHSTQRKELISDTKDVM